MKREYPKSRAILIFLAGGILYLIIIANLYRIQIIDHHFYQDLAEHQHTLIIHRLPPRAPIYDRTSTCCLAMNEPSLSAFITPTKLQNAASLHTFLAKHFPSIHKKLKEQPQAQFMFIKRNLSPADQQLFQQYVLPDIKYLRETRRFYPVPSATPVVGITDIDNKGISGLEQLYDHQLSGSPATFILLKDARAGYFHLSEEQTACGINAQPLITTLDAHLQFLVAQEAQAVCERLKAQEAAALILDPETGDILAMVNIPYADPVQRCMCDTLHTKNRIITDAYELGSVMKVFAAMAALEEGVVTAEELIDCRNTQTTYIEGRRINTWTPHGTIPFKDVVAFSNNIGTAIVAKRLQEKLYDHYYQLGISKKLHLHFPGQNPGFLNHPDNWSKQSIISLCYGYEVSATLLQLARACTVLAQVNKGHLVEPRLVKENTPPLRSADPLYSSSTLTTMREILTRTAEAGTAKRAYIKGYEVMCKTGTANLLVNGAYDKTRNIFTAMGIIKKDDYERIIITFIKEAQGTNLWASTVAVPLFRAVAERMVIHEKKV